MIILNGRHAHGQLSFGKFCNIRNNYAKGKGKFWLDSLLSGAMQVYSKID
jgi:hypothetical protein